MLSSTLLRTPPCCFLTHFEQTTSRKLLGHAHVLFFNQDIAAASTPAAAPPATSSTSAHESTVFGSINANVIMILAVLLCALICALVVNAVVRCVCGVVGRAWSETDGVPSGDSVRPCAPERQASARVRRKRAVRSLPCFAYATGGLGDLTGSSGTECAICLCEFAPGERVRLLPKCGHGFHVRCIDRWLAKQSSCPTCRQCLFGHDEEAARPAAVTDDYREEDR